MTKYNKILNMKIVKERINEAMDRARQSGREQGFNICNIGEDFIATEVVDGDRDSITIENTCPGVKVGSFHVHTESRAAIPSPKDLANLDDGDEKFFCIGVNIKNTKDREIKCFDNDDLKPLSYFKTKKNR